MNTKGYEKDETAILEEYVKANTWLQDILVDYGKNNDTDITAEDAFITVRMPDGSTKRLIAEVKEEEPYFVCKNKNITLDAVSVFHYLPGAENNRINSMSDLRSASDPRTLKYGSMYNDNIDILIKKIKGTSMLLAYDNHKLAAYRRQIEQNSRLHVNPKKQYGLDDTWESAFYALSIGDPALIGSMIIGRDNFNELLSAVEEPVSHAYRVNVVPAASPAEAKKACTCSGCGREIRSERILRFSQNRYGRPYCWDCQQAMTRSQAKPAMRA